MARFDDESSNALFNELADWEKQLQASDLAEKLRQIEPAGYDDVIPEP